MLLQKGFSGAIAASVWPLGSAVALALAHLAFAGGPLLTVFDRSELGGVAGRLIGAAPGDLAGFAFLSGRQRAAVARRQAENDPAAAGLAGLYRRILGF